MPNLLAASLTERNGDNAGAGVDGGLARWRCWGRKWWCAGEGQVDGMGERAERGALLQREMELATVAGAIYLCEGVGEGAGGRGGEGESGKGSGKGEREAEGRRRR